MENSRRNLIIIVVAIFVLCLCVVVIGVGVLGFFLPINRITTVSQNNESVALETGNPTAVPTFTQEVLATPTQTTLPTSTVEESEPLPTAEATEEPTQESISPAIAAQMDQIESEVISLRNLQPAGEVKRALLTRSQLREKIETDFFEDYTPEEARDDSIVLAALGLLEPGFDMFTFYQDLLSEQIAGQYDHTKKEMDVVQGFGFGGPERLTYAHEYAHALQDQNFDIENGLNYTDEACEEDSERCAAVQALLEGDASKLELEWFTNFSTNQDMIDIQNFYAEFESPVYDSAPAFLREDFIFPYTFGQTFVEYLYSLGGWDAVNEAYLNVPVSTEQIIHPERYPLDQPENIDIPDLSPLLGEGWREIDRGVMGEWYTYLILAHGLQPEARLPDIDAQAASDGWGGDVYVVYYNEQTDSVVLVMHTFWESVNDASQFYSAFNRHSTSRFGAPANNQTDQIGWSHPGGYTQLNSQGQFTTWIFAPDEGMVVLISSTIQDQ
jgi:hypothetical protein